MQSDNLIDSDEPVLVKAEPDSVDSSDDWAQVHVESEQNVRTFAFFPSQIKLMNHVSQVYDQLATKSCKMLPDFKSKARGLQQFRVTKHKLVCRCKRVDLKIKSRFQTTKQVVLKLKNDTQVRVGHQFKHMIASGKNISKPINVDMTRLYRFYQNGALASKSKFDQVWAKTIKLYQHVKYAPQHVPKVFHLISFLVSLFLVFGLYFTFMHDDDSLHSFERIEIFIPQTRQQVLNQVKYIIH